MNRPKGPRKQSVSITISESAKTYYRVLGGGNLSCGVELGAKLISIFNLGQDEHPKKDTFKGSFKNRFKQDEDSELEYLINFYSGKH